MAAPWDAKLTGSDGSEAFLTRRVPDLEFNAFSIELDCSDFKVDTNCGDERRSERVVGESEEEARLADPWGKTRKRCGRGGMNGMRKRGPLRASRLSRRQPPARSRNEQPTVPSHADWQ